MVCDGARTKLNVPTETSQDALQVRAGYSCSTSWLRNSRPQKRLKRLGKLKTRGLIRSPLRDQLDSGSILKQEHEELWQRNLQENGGLNTTPNIMVHLKYVNDDQRTQFKKREIRNASPNQKRQECKCNVNINMGLH